MHRCAAKCCEDKESSLSSVQSCVERCSGPLNKAQQYVQVCCIGVRVMYMDLFMCIL